MKCSKLIVTVLASFLPAISFGLEISPAVKVSPLLRTTSSWDGNPIVYPDGQAEITGMVVEIAPGGETGWHQHPVPSFGVVLEGTLAVTLKDGRVKHLHAGEALVEVVNTLHNGRNTGDKPVRIIVFYAGTVGRTLTVP